MFFAAILFSAPVYIYWGRGFMMETAALFFMLAGMRFFIDALHVVQPTKSLLLFAFFTALSMLQKASTAIPVLVVLSLVVLPRNMCQVPHGV